MKSLATEAIIWPTNEYKIRYPTRYQFGDKHEMNGYESSCQTLRGKWIMCPPPRPPPPSKNNPRYEWWHESPSDRCGRK